MEEWAENVGEGVVGSEELSETCDGEPKVSREFRDDLRMGVRELREEPWLSVGDREG